MVAPDEGRLPIERQPWQARRNRENLNRWQWSWHRLGGKLCLRAHDLCDLRTRDLRRRGNDLQAAVDAIRAALNRPPQEQLRNRRNSLGPCCVDCSPSNSSPHSYRAFLAVRLLTFSYVQQRKGPPDHSRGWMWTSQPS